ncbi:hypothetical protein [Indiicoccus explosivorum]|uniref:hypothetical protein n=1 Tax=Indiicoccus explosivorum TaxID=1917864 RepID=UPI000B42F42C|nr:hypothetical protein [Indiicoccus explosivorum]
MKRNVYETYILAVEQESDGYSINSAEFEELKAHIHAFLEEHDREGKSGQELKAELYREFGNPAELAQNLAGDNKRSKLSLPLTAALLAAGVAAVSPYTYAPIGLYMLFISSYMMITKKPFALAYYRKNPHKVNNHGFLWSYSFLIFALGLFLLSLEWQR